MPTPPIHAVTGATGFIGRALVLELLATTDADIVCLVRPSSRPGRSATRLFAGLADAARSYGYPDRMIGDIPRRCRAVTVDLHHPLPAAARALESVQQVWHCAGSLRYHERDRQLIEQTNIVGTMRMLRLAADLGVAGFHYLSSAYVAGRRDGVIAEERADPTAAQNVYEQSKVHAEELVLSTTTIRTTVLRPSVVIGHSRTAAVSGSLSGIYGLGVSLARYAGPDGVRMQLDPRATANLVPIDQVAAEAVACGLAGRSGEIFHLVANPTISVGELLTGICRAFDIGPLTFVDTAAELDQRDRRLAERMDYYLSYMRGDKVFDRTNTDRVVGDGARRYAGRPALADVWRWYADSFGQPDSLAVPAGAR